MKADLALMPTSDIRQILSEVKDPEIPVLSILDMGIVRELRQSEGAIEVVITPTYSGCPAMDAIAFDIKAVLLRAGFEKVTVNSTLSPAWTTDWLSEEGKQKLLAYGIAPPEVATTSKRALFTAAEGVHCPHCKSSHTERVSEFGSTACKALYRCRDCREPFDYFKCI
jgi:ring-1,2-phenylacetyl-CoA epoxidase subunit PaaD